MRDDLPEGVLEQDGLSRREVLKHGAALGGAVLIWAPPTAQVFTISEGTAQATSGHDDDSSSEDSKSDDDSSSEDSKSDDDSSSEDSKSESPGVEQGVYGRRDDDD